MIFNTKGSIPAMRDIVDIHSHILPGMDDGARTIEDAVQMGRMAANSGVKTMVATPHSIEIDMHPELAYTVNEAVDLLNHIFIQEDIPLTLVAGMEIFARDDVTELLGEGILLPLGDTHNVLVEFDFDDDTEHMGYIFYELIKAGYAPVVAHPERYFEVMRDPSVVSEWIKMGCKLQINKGSILGRFGNTVRRTAGILLEKDLVFTVASDAHSPFVRTPHMREAMQELIHLTDTKTAEKLLCLNPRSLLHI